MHFNLLVFLIFLLLNVGLWRYIDHAIHRRTARKALRGINLGVSALAILMLAPMGFIARGEVSEPTFMLQMWFLIGYLSITFGQLIFVVVDLIACAPLLVPLIDRLLKRPVENPGRYHRLKYVSAGGAVLGVIVFITIWWGALINRYNIDVKDVTVEINNLPDSFDGYRIVQISDLHVGSYGSDTSYIEKVVRTVNSLHPDLIVFTGDIVNRHSTEADPFMPVLSSLTAPDGQYAILGNHDYADYYYPSDREDLKQADRARLRALYDSSSLCLLCDEHIWLRQGSDSIALIGVENIGVGRFPKYGSLEKAYPELDDSNIKILLSHDPAHWETEIADHPEVNVALTLSGHTHAMQTRIFGFSPASFIYDIYEGLHTDVSGTHQLYINIGIGTVGTPMRIGATPEITVITLRKAK